MRRALIAALAVAALACGSNAPSQQEYRTVVRATVDERDPLQGVQIEIRGRAVGATDAAGELTLTLRGSDGLRVPISATCPMGYRLQTPPRALILRRVLELDPEGGTAPLRIAVSCAPTRRRAVLLVRAGTTGGLPITIDERPAGATTATGVAHLLLSAPPGKRIEVRLDTSSRADLRPQNPSRVFVFPDASDVFVFDQVFEAGPTRNADVAEPRPRRRPRRQRAEEPRPEPRPQLPTKITR